MKCSRLYRNPTSNIWHKGAIFAIYIYAYIYTYKYFDTTYQGNNIQLNISIINNFEYYQFLSMTGLENSEWDSVSFGNRSTYMLSK